MEGVLPELVWQEGSCHRINNHHDLLAPLPPTTQHHSQRDYECAMSDDEIDEDIQGLKIINNSNGRIQASLHVAEAYYKYIIGKNASTRKSIMQNTQTEIKIPPRNVVGDISISGVNYKNVLNAVRKINSIVLKARKKQQINYFLAIPLNNQEIMKNFEKFKNDVLSSGTYRGVDKSIFSEGNSLHLTLYVFAIMDEQEMEYVEQLLEIAKKDIVDPICKKMSIPLIISNIAYMNDDPTSINVLYAEAVEKIEEQKGILLKLLKTLSDFFIKKGFCTSKPTEKIHMTLMNTRNRSNKENENDPFPMRIPFDGSKILKDHSNYYFGECVAKEIQFFKTGRLPNGNYVSSGTISIV